VVAGKVAEEKRLLSRGMEDEEVEEGIIRGNLFLWRYPGQ